MAIIIQNRRGSFTNFDPTKLKPGEWAIVQENDPNSTDGIGIYICVSTGNIKRIASIDELGDYNNQGEQILATIRTIATSIDAQATRATTKANEAEQSASQADVAKQQAQSAESHTEQLATQAEATITAQTNIAIQRINDAADARAATVDTDGIIHL